MSSTANGDGPTAYVALRSSAMARRGATATPVTVAIGFAVVRESVVNPR